MAAAGENPSINLANGQEVLERLQRGDHTMLTEIYRVLRPEFLKWALPRFQLREDELVDIFQDSVIILNRNIAHGKLTELKTSVKTYLFAIAKNLVLKRLRGFKEVIQIDDMPESLLQDWTLDETMSLNHKQSLMAEALQRLGSPCDKILKLFYYRGFAMEAIKEQLGYKNESVVRSQKKRCMQYLRELINNSETDLS